MDNESAAGKVVITGAAGGIGQALVRSFADAGYGVIATDRVDPPAYLPCQHYVVADLQRTVTDPDYASSIFGQVRNAIAGQPFKALVNNAAAQILGTADTLSREDWATTLQVNLLAPFFWAQALLLELEASAGMVLNISSIHARLTKPNFIAYASSKAALSGMSRAMAVELGARVRVNAIEPAAIETDMLRSGFSEDPQAFERLVSCHPTQALGAAMEVASLAVALVDGRLPFMNGACIALDGGIGSRLHDPQ